MAIRKGDERDARNSLLWRSAEGWVRKHSKGEVFSISPQGSITGWQRTVGGLRLRHVELAESEVTERNVARVVEQDVLGLEITVVRERGRRVQGQILRSGEEAEEVEREDRTGRRR